MKILLTGGTGLIGRHLIPRLLELGIASRSPRDIRYRPRPFPIRASPCGAISRAITTQ